MTIGTLTATLGVDAQGAINSMTHFERTMITLVNKIDSTLERMEASMAGVTGAAMDMRNKTVAGFTATAQAVTVATVATTQYTTAVVAANAATKASVVAKGTSAISQSAINNSLAGAAGVRGVASTYNVSPMIAKDAINQTIVVARENAKQVASFNKMHSQAIAMDNKRTQIVNANRIKEAYAEADAATKRITSFNKMHERAIAEDNKRTVQIIANREKEAAFALGAMDRQVARVQTLAQKFRTFGYLGSAMVTLPLVLAGKAAIKTAGDYEFTIQKLVGLAGVAQEEANKISKAILEMANSVGQTPQTLAESVYFILSAGIKDTAKALDILEKSAKGATAGLGETNDVAKLMVYAMNSYKNSNLSTIKIMDMMTVAVREGAIEADGFASAAQSVIPAASAMRVSLGQVLGTMAAMSQQGATAANAATYIRNILNSLIKIKPSNQAGKALKELGSSGIELRRILGTGPNGLMNVLLKIQNWSDQPGNEDLLAKVFGNIRSMTGEMNLMGDRLKENQKLINDTVNANGDWAVSVAATANTIDVRLANIGATMKIASTAFGESLANVFLPVLEKWAERLKDIALGFAGLDKSTQELIIKVLGLVAALAPLSLISSFIMYIYAGLVPLVTKLAGAFTWLNRAVLVNPWVAAVTGIVLAGEWLIHYKKKMADASESQDSFNKSLVKVNDSIKKLKDLTDIDFSAMNINEAVGVQKEANKQYMEAKRKIKEIQDSGITWLQMKTGGQKRIDTLTQEAILAKKAYEEASKVIDEWAGNFGKATTSGTEFGNMLGGITEELDEQIRIHKLVLEQYDAELKKEKGELKYKSLIIQLNKDLRKSETNYGSFPNRFLAFPADVASGPTKLENDYAKGLYSYKEYLDAKYKMDLVAAGQSADARMQVETQYIKDLRALRLTDIQSYLQSTSDAISAISSLIEASKQRELSAVGQNAVARERIEKQYMQKQKAWSIAQALINGALAITNLMANVPLSVLNPATWVGIGVAAASTAAQVAIIAGQKMEHGGVVPPGFPNDSYPARLTSGETVLPKALSGAAYNNQISGDVYFHIKDYELVGILKKAGIKNTLY